MMFNEFECRCRLVFEAAARKLDALAASERVSARDNAAAQMSQMFELAAPLAVAKRVDRATFLDGAAEAYDAATIAILTIGELPP